MLIFSILGLCVDNFLVLWGLLEVYGVFFLVLVFLNKNSFNRNKIIYFGVVNLIRRLLLLSSILLDLSFLRVVGILAKMGSFPFKEWVVKFCSRVSPINSFLFFTLNKVLPLYMLREFLNFNLLFSLVILVANWVICFPNIMKSWQLIQVISWSSIVRNGYFLLLASVDLSGVVLISLLVYSMILFLVFYSMKDSYYFKGRFFIIVLLFGVPPFSVFLFKVVFFVALMEFFSVFWVYFFSGIFFLLGVRYFSFFVKESFKIFSGVEYTGFFPRERKI